MNDNDRTREILIVCSLATVFLVTASVGEHEFQITAEPHDQCLPAIYGDIVVWQDNRNGNWDIYGYDLSTKEEFQIAAGPSDQVYPAICNRRVVWKDQNDEFIDLFVYDLSTKETVKIPVESAYRGAPAIYNDVVVWADYRGSGLNIYGYNLLTQQEFQVCTHPGGQRNPAIYGNIVVWEDWRGDYSTIYGYDLVTQEEVLIGVRGYLYSDDNQHDPAIYGSTVVWAEMYDETIYTYNTYDSQKTTIASTHTRNCRLDNDFWMNTRGPAIYKDVIVWVDCRNGNRDIYGFNLLTHQEAQLTWDTNSQQSPALYGDVMVWEDTRNGNYDIYGCTLSSAAQTVPVSSRTPLLVRDFLMVAMIVLSVLSVVFAGGNILWGTARFTKRSDDVPWSKADVKDFKRDNVSLVLYIVSAIVSGLFGILFIYMEGLPGIMFLALAALLAIFISWNKKIPSIRITNEEIIVYRFMLEPDKITWETIKRIDFYKDTDKVELILSDRKRGIDVMSLGAEGRSDLITALRHPPCEIPFFYK
jgi:beta propeller repeat protein